MNYYTGIGSRTTPAPILATMREIAVYLAAGYYTLRSGGAKGADTAFEQTAGERINIYLPWNGFNNRWDDTPGYIYGRIAPFAWKQAERIAANIHPNWKACDEKARALHTRNIFQVTGSTLDAPSQFVVYWAPEKNGEPQGGTRTAVMYAQELDIPTFNLLHGTEAFKAYLRATQQHDAAHRTGVAAGEGAV